MALIISLRLFTRWYGGAPFPIKNEASNFFTGILSTYLSEAYDLNIGCKLKGQILKLEVAGEKLPQFRGKEIVFVLYPHMGSDYLFISKDHWKENFRDYGLIESFSLSARIEKAVKDIVEIPLYLKRDVTI